MRIVWRRSGRRGMEWVTAFGRWPPAFRLTRYGPWHIGKLMRMDPDPYQEVR